MLKRFPQDKSCSGAVPFQVGRCQMIKTTEVTAGDSVELNMLGRLRFAELVRPLTFDPKYDVISFFVPYRYCYDNWIDFFMDGNYATTPETLATVSTGGSSPDPVGYLGTQNASIPAHLVAGYAKFWNEYCRVPVVTTTLLDEGTLLTAGDDRDYGYPVARLPSMWTVGAASTADTSLANVDANNAAADLTLFDIVQTKGQYEQDVLRHWDAQRYRDLVKHFSGALVSADVDQRPHIMAHTEGYASGRDINGTDDATLGQSSGIAEGVIRHQMRKKFFAEHGTLWTVMFIRFPPMAYQESTYIHNNAMTYENTIGDPEILGTYPPVELDSNDMFGDGGSETMGYYPYGSWYRREPNRIHHKFEEVDGYPFLDKDDVKTTLNDLVYETGNLGNTYFKRRMLGDAWMAFDINQTVNSIVLPSGASYEAGLQK